MTKTNLRQRCSFRALIGVWPEVSVVTSTSDNKRTDVRWRDDRKQPVVVRCLPGEPPSKLIATSFVGNYPHHRREDSMLRLLSIATAILLILAAFPDHAIWRLGCAVNLYEPVVFGVWWSFELI